MYRRGKRAYCLLYLGCRNRGPLYGWKLVTGPDHGTATAPLDPPSSRAHCLELAAHPGDRRRGASLAAHPPAGAGTQYLVYLLAGRRSLCLDYAARTLRRASMGRTWATKEQAAE